MKPKRMINRLSKANPKMMVAATAVPRVSANRIPIIIKREIISSAPIEAVWKAWTTPDEIKQWNAASDDWHTTAASVDLRVGGSFSFLVRRQGQEIDHVGEYLELDRPRHLAFTWGAGAPGEKPDMSRLSIDISAIDNGCELTLTHELHPDWADFADRTREGWTKILEALASALV